MIRNTVVAVLTHAALAAALMWFPSTRSPVNVHVSLKPGRTQYRSESRFGFRHGCFYLGHAVFWSVPVSGRRSFDGEVAGFSLYYRRGPGNGWNTLGFRSWSAGAPIWALVVLLGSCPSVAIIRGPLRRYRRLPKGLCLKCGYNLTGLPEPRCPECGEAVLSAT